MKTELKQIIDELKEASKGLKVKDDSILENAVKIYLSSVIHANKERNIERVNEQRKPYPNASNKPKNANEPLSEKQKAFLIKNEYQGNINELTKEEARILIKEFLEGRKEEEDEYSI
jgi:hypothetical protein